jgi:hypothetical protein
MLSRSVAIPKKKTVATCRSLIFFFLEYSFTDYITCKEHDDYIKIELVLYSLLLHMKKLIISSNVLFIRGIRLFAKKNHGIRRRFDCSLKKFKNWSIHF